MPKEEKREYRVTWRRDTGHASQTRYYQRDKAAQKFFDGLTSEIKTKRFESRIVGEWEPKR